MLEQFCKPPSLESIKRALFIQPHPDDNEIGAGGTMAYLKSLGAEVFGLTVTDDSFLPGQTDSSGLSTRQREALAAMSVLGVENAGFLGFHDKTRASIEELSAKILPVIRDIRPDAVFCPDPKLENECHSDHIKVGWAVRFCVLDAGCDFFPDMPNGKPREDTWKVSVLGHFYTSIPNTVVDISAFTQKKYTAISCHKSQVSHEFLSLLELQDAAQAEGTGFHAAERIRLLSALQMHCFVYPVK